MIEAGRGSAYLRSLRSDTWWGTASTALMSDEILAFKFSVRFSARREESDFSFRIPVAACPTTGKQRPRNPVAASQWATELGI